MARLSKEAMTTEAIRDMVAGFATGKDYLEIGVYRGVLLTEIGKVAKTATGIDSFAQFDPDQQNEQAVRDRIAGMNNTRLIVGDCYKAGVLSKVKNGSVDVMFYDAGHTREQTREALLKYAKKMRSGGVVIMDDWNQPEVQAGTIEALSQLPGWDISYYENTSGNGDPIFWNGVCVIQVP